MFLLCGFGSSFSDLSRFILFFIVTLISTYEMWKLRKGKSMLFHFFTFGY